MAGRLQLAGGVCNQQEAFCNQQGAFCNQQGAFCNQQEAFGNQQGAGAGGGVPPTSQSAVPFQQREHSVVSLSHTLEFEGVA